MVQCLLCGCVQSDGNLYRKHFIRNHCNYGYHRRCNQCGRHFSEKSELTTHVCPGLPIVYSRKTGEFYYRGSSTTTMLNFPVYPRLRHNQLIGHGECKSHCAHVQKPTFQQDYHLSELPLGKMDASEYTHREYAPMDPPVPPNSTVVAVFEPPDDRSVLEHIYKLYICDRKDYIYINQVKTDQNVQQLVSSPNEATVGSPDLTKYGSIQSINPFKRQRETQKSAKGMHIS